MVISLEDILEDPRRFMDSGCKDVVIELDERAHKLDVAASAQSFMKIMKEGIGLPAGGIYVNNRFNVSMEIDRKTGEVVRGRKAELEEEYLEARTPYLTSMKGNQRLVVPLNNRGRNFGVAVFDKGRFSRKKMATILYSVKMFSRHLRRMKRLSSLEHEAITDFLTGMHTKRSFDMHYRSAIKQAKRLDNPLSVIVGDIDNFKQVNDTYGHDFGDYVLRTVGQIIRSSIRDGDIAGRCGGDEFAIILPNTAQKDASKVARKINGAVRSREFDDGGLTGKLAKDKYFGGHDSRSIRTTLSAKSNEDVKNWSRATTLFKAADRLLYQAKEYGRDAVNTGDNHDPDTDLPDIPKMDAYLRKQVAQCNRQRGVLALTMFDVRGFKFVINKMGEDAAWNLFFSAVKEFSSDGNRYDALARVYDSDKIIGSYYSEKRAPAVEKYVAEIGNAALEVLRSFCPEDISAPPLDFAAGVCVYSPRFVSDRTANRIESNPGLLSTFATAAAITAGDMKERLFIDRYTGQYPKQL